MIAQHHEDRWTSLVSNWKPATSTKYRRQGTRPARRWEDDLNICLQPDRANRDNNDLTTTKYTTKAHNQNENDTKDGDDTLLILSPLIDS